jgi:hypothetical protein
MSTLKQRVLTNWHLMRIIRLGLGIWMLVMAIQSKDIAIGLFSAFFLYTAIAGVGCCGPNGCYVPDRVVSKEKK